jgi:hypothetical protein
MERKIRVLNCGFVEVQDVSGADFLVRSIADLINFRFLIKCPKFIALSTFYAKGLGKFSDLISDSSDEEYYIPSSFSSSISGLTFTEEEQNVLHTKVQNLITANCNFIKKLESKDVSKLELDFLKPQTIYAKFYWVIPVNELVKWLNSVWEKSIIKEEKEYAAAILELFREKLPHTSETFLRR